ASVAGSPDFTKIGPPSRMGGGLAAAARGAAPGATPTAPRNVRLEILSIGALPRYYGCKRSSGALTLVVLFGNRGIARVSIEDVWSTSVTRTVNTGSGSMP